MVNHANTAISEELRNKILRFSDFGSDFKARLRSMHETIHGYRYATKCVDLTTIDLKPEAHLRKCRSRCTTAATRSVVRKVRYTLPRFGLHACLAKNKLDV